VADELGRCVAILRSWLGFGVLLICGSLTAVSEAAVQRPGGGWAMLPSSEREIKRLYWKEFDQTEAWIRLDPRSTESDRPIPAALVFSAVVKGAASLPFDAKHRPQRVQLETQPDPKALVVTPTLVFQEPGGERLDLIVMGYGGPQPGGCDGCGSRSVLASLDSATFRRLANAGRLECEVLGFRCTLDPAGTTALKEFGRAIGLLTP
jgi:hypothetical protein